ncbi:WS/DGAT/MGAT family O-acyltransferase [Sandarakinorhabdus oryzae]|uniref:WS/DGAT/MGAT family O-acyltransferase n=1 Tax=Sandarakinorhabdus oryzae TaxID=2675220 RepID=UPI0012E1ECC0|nr:wax ester/triacylglycerol synthase family O-acyltransferase [Sandarakinorhabdus oryzae]
MAEAVKLSSLDASFLYMETPEMPMHVGSLSMFQLPKGYKGDYFEDFKAQIADRLDDAPMLKRKLASTVLDLANPSWVEDEQFDIDRQIFRASLAAPHDMAALKRTVGWMHAKLLNRARPLWEFYLFENMPGNQVGLYVKIHHALIDGGAGMALTKIIYDVVPNPPPRVREAAAKTEEPAKAAPPLAETASTAMESYLRFWQQPFDASAASNFSLPRSGKTDLGSVLMDHMAAQVELGVKMAAALPAMAGAAARTMASLLDPSRVSDLKNMVAPKTPLNKAISSERAFATITLPLSRVKAVGKAAGGSINDMVMAISAGILRRYLQETDSLPDRPLSAGVPISLREEGNANANNQVFGMICPLATDIADPKQRLATIIGEARKSKEMVSPFKDFVPIISGASTLGLPMAAQIASLFYSRSGLSDVLPPPINVCISNVPGPRMSLYAAGAELLHLYPVSIVTHGMALNITVQSYRDQLEFGLIAGANILPDVQRLADMMADELDVLEQAFAQAA